MQKYIVYKKGLFGTLYVSGANYDRYQSTTKEKEKAYKFTRLKEAQKAQKSINGEIEELFEQEITDDHEIYEKTHCKDCIFFDSIACQRSHLNMDPMDFCSRGLRK